MVAMAGSVALRDPDSTTIAFLQGLCTTGNTAVASAALDAQVILLKAPRDLDLDSAAWSGPVAANIRYAAPSVLFVAPDGTILKTLSRKIDEDALTAAIQSVPKLLTDWITKHRTPPAPAPAAVDGVRVK